ncbi:MAG TPA: DUF4181 domain-containing protein, partial [Pseudoneobacillus sp.]|nr:DUF4181 domain-containing protein [Pseudoneobacillus sp.]
KYVNTVHKWIERVIFLGFIFALWFFKDSFSLMISFFIIIFGIRSFMEWKYESEKREYIITLFSICNLLLFLGIVTVFT